MLLFALAACTPPKDVTFTKPYADLIGGKYAVVADDLYADGVYESLGDKRVTSIVLVPKGIIGGPEYAFRRTVPKETVIRILSAWVFFPRRYYLVALEHEEFPKIPVLLYLEWGNEGTGVDLNPSVYQKLPADK